MTRRRLQRRKPEPMANRSSAASRIDPSPLLEGRVEASDLDSNGHMNIARYTAVFDEALEVWIARQLGPLLPKTSGIFVLETHCRYERELREGAHFAIAGRLLAADDKRAHFLMRMTDLDRGQRAATAEILTIHVDLVTRRAAAWPAEIAARLADARIDPQAEPGWRPRGCIGFGRRLLKEGTSR